MFLELGMVVAMLVQAKKKIPQLYPIDYPQKGVLIEFGLTYYFYKGKPEYLPPRL
jgi:hypothetical protein